MFRMQLSRFALAAVLVSALGFLVPAVSQAAGPAGTGPGDAMAPTGTTEHLNVGQSRWYAFYSAGKDSNGDPSHVLIELYAQPDGSAGFNVWTAERLAERATAANPTTDAPPIGVGSVAQIDQHGNTVDLFNGALIWASGINDPGTYLVEVYQTGEQASAYTLSITGDAVSFPTSVTTSQLAQPMSPAAEAAAAGTPSGGTGPGDALAPSPNWQHLNVGQSRWYAFSSAGKDSNGDPSHVLITLYNQPDGSAGFNLWTPERLAERATAANPNTDAPPIGVGSVAQIDQHGNTVDLFNGATIWAGGFNDPGKFLVEVSQTGAQPSDYKLSIQGDAVTFP
jgi:hypothetical protein